MICLDTQQITKKLRRLAAEADAYHSFAKCLAATSDSVRGRGIINKLIVKKHHDRITRGGAALMAVSAELK